MRSGICMVCGADGDQQCHERFVVVDHVAMNIHHSEARSSSSAVTIALSWPTTWPREHQMTDREKDEYRARARVIIGSIKAKAQGEPSP